MDDPATLVERLYSALDGDDVAAILEQLADDAAVVYPAEGALPYGGTWVGHDGIARFLDLHDQAEEILDFTPETFATDEGQVVVRGRFAGRSKVTGRTWSTRWVHAHEVRDGRIQRWEAYFDTAAAVEAHRLHTD
jgi:uncharacterized protein